MILETNASNYVLIAILSIIIEEKKVYLVTFHFCMFKATDLNYNIYNQELLVVFKAFCIWYHYLERLELPIDIITDYKNLEYILTTKILSYYQAKWSEFFSQFILVICFCLESLRSKPMLLLIEKTSI